MNIFRHFCLALLAAASASAELPTVTVTADDTEIHESCRVVIPADTVIVDENEDGVLHIRASGITVEFAPGSHLRGSAADADPDTYAGYGIRIVQQRDVTLRKLRISGFRGGLHATKVNGLTLEDSDGSDQWRMRLYSDPLVEEGRDWLRPHDNDQNQWLTNYGAAFYIEDSNNVTVRRCKVYHSQNGLIFDRVNDSKVYDNDFSFNSGWGLGLWRSSRNVITRNALDFCVRGYSHKIYNRGQDSAGILAFEQNNDNVIAENSATHGGDGFFGYAGNEAMGRTAGDDEQRRADLLAGRLGNNRNLLINNDFSYAPAHGIENTFSFGNRFIGNRLVENAICGVWGGYSQDTLIYGNEFVRNGDMGYGMERGGVNIEFGRNNAIINNDFVENWCGVHLWWVEDRPSRGPWVTAHLPDYVNNIIADNRFSRDQLVFDFKGAGEVILARNKLDGVEDRLQTVGKPQVRTQPEIEIPPVEQPDYPVFGETRPVGARPHLRGRHQIVMTEWGPWDHASPLVRPLSRSGSTHRYALHHLAKASVKVVSGAVQTSIAPADKSAPPVLHVTSAAPGLQPYRLHLVADNFEQELAGVIVAATWDAVVFPFEEFPARRWREENVDDDELSARLAAWRAAAKGEAAQHTTLQQIELFRTLPGEDERARTSHRANRDEHRVGLVARTTLTIPAGSWRFEIVTDEGVRLTVGDETVIDQWRRRWMPRRTTGTLTLTESRNLPVVLEHFQVGRKAVLTLAVKPVPVALPAEPTDEAATAATRAD